MNRLNISKLSAQIAMKNCQACDIFSFLFQTLPEGFTIKNFLSKKTNKRFKIYIHNVELFKLNFLTNIHRRLSNIFLKSV